MKYLNRLLTYTGFIALIIWSYGLLNTIRALEEMQVPHDNYTSLVVGILVQVILTMTQHLVWDKKNNQRKKVVGIITLIIDTFFNVAGIYPYVTHLTHTTSYQMLELPTLPSLILVVFSILVALLVAILPEVLITD